MTDTNNRRQQRSDERRQRVLAVATEVFLHAGFQAARVDDIAERAEVSKKPSLRVFLKINAACLNRY